MIAKKPALEHREAQSCVYIPISVPFSGWGKANALVPEILAWMGKHGVTPAGPLFYRYAVIGDMKEEPFDLEIGFPVANGTEGDDRVLVGEIQAGIYAVSTHTGHPDGLFDTCVELLEWGEREGVQWDTRPEHGRTAWEGRYEFYHSNPDEVPDMNDWQTEVAFLTRGTDA